MKFRVSILSLMVLVFLVACFLSFRREQAARTRRRDSQLRIAAFYDARVIAHEQNVLIAPEGWERTTEIERAKIDRAEAIAHRQLAEHPEMKHVCAEYPRPPRDDMSRK